MRHSGTTCCCKSLPNSLSLSLGISPVKATLLPPDKITALNCHLTHNRLCFSPNYMQANAIIASRHPDKPWAEKSHILNEI